MKLPSWCHSRVGGNPDPLSMDPRFRGDKPGFPLEFTLDLIGGGNDRKKSFVIQRIIVKNMAAKMNTNNYKSRPFETLRSWRRVTAPFASYLSMGFSAPWKGRDKNGLTIVELLVAISIIVILGGIGFASLIASRNVRDLTTSSQNTLSVLRLAQSRTLAGENDSAWGVRLASNQITLFQGDAFPGSPLTQVFPLPDSMQITNIILNGGGSDVIFKRVTGETNQTGTFLLSVINAPSNSFAVTIDGSGKVYQTNAFPPPSIIRTVDTRHRSFALNWSIKNATILRLTFADPPSADTVTDITMSSFFDAGKTKFDWSGTVTIGGLPQVIRVHTTALTDSNTVLSVDRDCRKNTKKLTVAIVDILVKTIATYEANCITVTIGAFGGTISEP